MDGCSSLSDSNLRSVLNTMSGLKYLWLRGCINLSSIDFVDSMSLVQLNIAETNVADLSYLNDESSIDLASLFVKSTKINDYQFLLKNLCNNAGKWHEGNEDKNGKYNFTRESDPKFLGSTWYYSSLGLILQNSGMTINVPSDVSYFTVGASCANNTWNLSSCSKLKHIMLGGPSGHFILPENIDNLFFDFLGSPTYDFSKCKNLKFITFWYGDFDTRIGDSLETLPDENKLEYLELARCKITNLSFLNKFNTSKLKTLIVRGWNTAVSNKMTTLISSNGLESATNVTYLCIRNTSITGCDNINALENLQTLDLSYNNIGSVSFLSDLVTVTNANLGYNVFSQLPDLSKLNSLNTLSIFGCSNVTDLGPLESLIRDGTTLLRTLNLQDCTGLESVSSSNGYNNEDLIDRLKKAGCTNIITTGTRL